MTDPESCDSDSSEAGFSVGNPSSFDSESERNLSDFSVHSVDVSFSDEKIFVGAALPPRAWGARLRCGCRAVHRDPCVAGSCMDRSFNVGAYGK